MPQKLLLPVLYMQIGSCSAVFPSPFHLWKQEKSSNCIPLDVSHSRCSALEENGQCLKVLLFYAASVFDTVVECHKAYRLADFDKSSISPCSHLLRNAGLIAAYLRIRQNTIWCAFKALRPFDCLLDRGFLLFYTNGRWDSASNRQFVCGLAPFLAVS